jgi:hypothetical protein
MARPEQPSIPHHELSKADVVAPSKLRLESRSEQGSKLRIDRSEQESGSKAALALVVFSLRRLDEILISLENEGQNGFGFKLLYNRRMASLFGRSVR